MNTIIRCLIWLPLLMPLMLGAQAPWQYGKLVAPTGSHIIKHEDGTPFLWIGDTGWGLFQQLTREEVDHYLDTRQAQGFNVIQAVVFWYPHGGGLPNGPHNATNAYGHRPFTGAEDAPNTSEPLVVEGGSPTAPNDYWDHVDYIVQAIRSRQMYLALLPCWGRAYVTTQFPGSHQEYNVDEARAYGAFLGQRYQDAPHILWVLGGDAKAYKKGFDQRGTYQDWDGRQVFRAMAEGLVQGVTGQQPAWNEAHPAWDELLLTYHPDGDPSQNSSQWFHEDPWLTANGVEVWKEVQLVYREMLGDYQLDQPVKPSLFLEGSYEFGSYQHECGWVTPVKVRRQFYHTFFAGGAGHTYGAGPVWSMRGTGGGYSCGYAWKQALHFPGATQCAMIGKTFLQKYGWHAWIPSQEVVSRGSGTGEHLKVAVRHASSDLVLVYFSNNTHASIKNVLSAKASCQWFDPATGAYQAGPHVEAGEIKDMIPPRGWEDAILVLATH